MEYLALLIFICFTIYLLLADVKRSGRPSGALWIPLIWMFFAGTRELSQWLGVFTSYSPAAGEENPFDPILQFFLIIAGLVILIRRKPSWGQILVKNRWICLFFFFGALSIIWSDYPFVSLKRLAKAVGTLIMALIILTDERPYAAFRDVLRRLAILTIPLSLVLCNYFPGIGRTSFHNNFMYVGMAAGKNLLGQLCLLGGFCFASHVFLRGDRENELGSEPPKLLSYLFLAMIIYLLHLSNSATSLACLVVAVCLFLGSRVPWVADNPRKAFTVGVIVVGLGWLLQQSLDLQEMVLEALNRRPDLTTRKPMWDYLLDMRTNPILGCGYESFWMGPRMFYVWQKYPGIMQAHNGYLETYLSLGLVGLTLMAVSIGSGFLKARKQLTVNYPAAMIRLSILAIVALYNWTEASFLGTSNMWLVFFVAAMEIPTRQDWAV